MSWNRYLGSTFTVLLWAGCAPGNGETPADLGPAASAEPTFEPPVRADGLAARDGEDTGRVRIIHLSPDAGAVDVFMDRDERPILTDLSFLDGTEYLLVPDGDHTFHIAPAGAGIERAVAEVEVDVEEDQDYSAAAYGYLERGHLDVLAFRDRDSDISDDEVRLRVVHAADGVGEVDLTDFADDSDELVEDLEFGDDEVLEIDAGKTAFGIDTKDRDSDDDWRFRTPDLGADLLVNVYAVNTRSDGLLLVAQLPDGSVAVVTHDPRVRVLHASPTTPDVDVYAGNERIVSDLEYTDGTDWAILQPGTFEFRVFPEDQQGGEPSAAFDLGLELGRDYTAVAWGNSATRIAPLVSSQEGLREGDLRLQLLHGAEGVPPVDVREVSGGDVLVAGLAPGEARALDLPEGVRDLALDARDGAPLSYRLPDLGRDLLVTVVAVREEDGAVKLIALMPDGDTDVFSPR